MIRLEQHHHSFCLATKSAEDKIDDEIDGFIITEFIIARAKGKDWSPALCRFGKITPVFSRNLRIDWFLCTARTAPLCHRLKLAALSLSHFVFHPAFPTSSRPGEGRHQLRLTMASNGTRISVFIMKTLPSVV
jgi:hypothetical protein